MSLLGPIGRANRSAFVTHRPFEGTVDTAKKYVPTSEAISALLHMAAGEKGKAGESAANDLLTALFTGGNYKKGLL
jgi:hypothetical protein